MLHGMIFEVYFLVSWAIAEFLFKFKRGVLSGSKFIFPAEDGRAGKAGLFQMSRLEFGRIALDTQLENLGHFCLIRGNRKCCLFYKEKIKKKREVERKGRKKEGKGKDAGSEARNQALTRTSSEPAFPE